jgi:hypothetical protein
MGRAGEGSTPSDTRCSPNLAQLITFYLEEKLID